MSTPLPVGQRVQHDLFGLGTATISDASRTTIDFDEHGIKTFVTSMFQAQLVDGPPRPARARRSRAAKK